MGSRQAYWPCPKQTISIQSYAKAAISLLRCLQADPWCFHPETVAKALAKALATVVATAVDTAVLAAPALPPAKSSL